MAGVLSDSTIKNLQSQGFMIAEGIEPDSIQPASIDLRVGGVRLEYDHDEYTIGQGIDESTVKKVEFEQLTLEPKQAYVVGLENKLNIPADSIGLVFPRSSVTRLGLLINPIYFNPGYSGTSVVLVANVGESTLHLAKGTRIAQLVLAKLDTSPSKAYGDRDDAKYQGEDVSHSKIYTDVEINQILDEIVKEKTPSIANN